MDCLILVGHTEFSPGARETNSDEGYSEFDFVSELARQIQKEGNHRGLDVNIVFRYSGSGANPDTVESALASTIKHYNPRTVIDLHCNWLHPKHVKESSFLWDCTTALIPFDSEISKNLAECIVEPVGDLLGTATKKIQEQTRSWSRIRTNDNGNKAPGGRLLFPLLSNTCPSIFLETHVFNHAKSQERARACLADGSLAATIVEGLEDFLDHC